MADLKELLSQPGPWTWLYTDGRTGEPPGAVESRMRSLTDRLHADGVPAADVDAAVAAMEQVSHLPAPSARWLLVRDGTVELDEAFAVGRLGAEQYGHGTFPEILPLLRHLAGQSRILTVETGRDGAELTVAQVGQSTTESQQSVQGEDQQITKVQAGGWSQARYQRHAEDVWQHNQSDVADAVDRIVRERRPAHIFLTGDVRARQLLRERLGGEAAELVVEVDADTRAAGADDTALQQAIEQTLSSTHRARLDEVHDRAAAGDGRAGATGPSAVVEALQQAQVDTLVLDPRMTDAAATLLALESAPWIAVTQADAFGMDGTALPAAEALARAAVLTDAEVLFLEDELAEDEPRPDRPAAPPTAALRWATDAADATGTDGPDGAAGHRDAATGHPSQAEGEDDDATGHDDTGATGHPSPAEG